VRKPLSEQHRPVSSDLSSTTLISSFLLREPIKERPMSAKTSAKRKAAAEATDEGPVSDAMEAVPIAATTTVGSKARKTSSAALGPSITRSYTPDDFRGAETFCRNAGKKASGLNQLMEKVSALTEEEAIAFAVVWNDLTSNHAGRQHKYCVPSQNCTIWHCSCERTVRASVAHAPLLGVLILLPKESDVVYYLPLGLCQGESIPHMPHLVPQIPISCETTYASRWDAFLTISTQCRCKKVVFDAQTALLPILQNNSSPILHVMDPKIAAYLCETTRNDEELGLDSILSKRGVSVVSRSKSRGPMGCIANVISTIHDELQAIYTVYWHYEGQLKESNSYISFRDVEMPLTQVLSIMELRGVRASLAKFNEIDNLIRHRIASLSLEAHAAVGESFNLASPDQVAQILFTKLKLGAGINIKGGKKHLSTNSDVLEEIVGLHPVIQIILDFRAFSKVLSTYIEGIRDRHLYSSGVHARWNHTSTRTGRLSSSFPNLQTIPKQLKVSGIDINVRSAFLPTHSVEGLLIAADYSQIEMRILAHVSQDRNMIQLFRTNGVRGDVYTMMASNIFDKQIEAVTPDERQKAKVKYTHSQTNITRVIH